MKKRLLVYVLHHDSSLSIYVGKSSYGLLRPREHAKPSQIETHPNWPVSRWVKKLQDQGFRYTITVLEDCSSAKELIAAEMFYIAYFRSVGARLLNCSDGGEGPIGFRHTEETKRKIGDIHRGKKLSQEQLDALAKANVGRKMTPEQRQHLSDVKRGKPRPLSVRIAVSAAQTERMKNPIWKAAFTTSGHTPEATAKRAAKLRGRKLSAETCAKMSASKTGVKLSPERCALQKQALRTFHARPFKDQHGTVYKTQAEAAEKLSIDSRSISWALANKKITHGYSFTYTDVQ